MSVSCDSTTLLNNSICQFQCIPPGYAKAIQIMLLCNILNGITVTDCSATNLVAQAKCFYPCVLNGSADAIIIYLLCQITASGTGGGGGGSGSVFRGTGSPEGVQVATVAGSLFYDPVAGSLWEFGGTAGQSTGWVQIV